MKKDFSNETPNSWINSALLRQSIAFAVLFVLLRGGYDSDLALPVTRWIIDHATVQSAALAINFFDPGIQVHAVGSRLQTLEGGINILNGCDGMDVLFLLFSAIAIAPMSLLDKTTGLLLGTLVVWMLNLIRVIVLFYAFRHDRGLFEVLHGIISPVVLMVAVALFFMVWLDRHAMNSSHPYVNPDSLSRI